MSDPVDVVVLTMNSERSLRKCLDSIYKNVPVNKLIIVDGYSSDKTIEIVKASQKKKRNVIIIQDRGSRGRARQLGIDSVETDWFMFVDSDVVLSSNWFNDAERLIRDEVGAIWGMEIWSVLRESKILALFERASLKIFEKRGAMHDILVRRKAVESIEVPPHLHTYEDAYIKSWIQRKGFKVIGTYKPYCIHHRSNAIWTFKHLSFMGSDLKYSAQHPSLFFPYAFHTLVEIYQIVIHKLNLMN